ncbi:hypothetical protein SRHO_G00227700 [Serrasalmus rhombeus]
MSQPEHCISADAIVDWITDTRKKKTHETDKDMQVGSKARRDSVGHEGHHGGEWHADGKVAIYSHPKQDSRLKATSIVNKKHLYEA